MKQIRCPGCQSRLATGEEVAAAITCPKCGIRFKTGAEKPAPAAPAPSVPSAPVPIKAGSGPKSAAARGPEKPKKRRDIEEDENDDEDEGDEVAEPKRKGGKRSEASGFPWVIVGSVGAAALVIGVGLTIFFLTRGQPVAKAPNPPPEEKVAEVKPAPRPAPVPKPEPNPEPRPEPKPEPEPEPEIAKKPDVRPETPPIVKPAPKPQPAPETKVDVPFIVGLNLGFNVPAVSLANQEKKLGERVEYNRRTLGKAYDKIGKKNARWDVDARAALEEAAQMFARSYETKSDWNTVREPAKRAVDAKCDDPLILYLYAKSLGAVKDIDSIELRDHTVKAAVAIEKSKYPPFRRAAALQLAADAYAKPMTPEDPANKVAERLSNAALLALVASAKDDEKFPSLEKSWYDRILEAGKLRIALYADVNKGLVAVEEIILRSPNLHPAALKARATIVTSIAWAARGDGPTDTVTEESRRLFKEKLIEARGALERAWKLKSDDGQIAAMMVANCKTLTGDHTETLGWFEQAMKADPDNREACEYVIEHLDPKWQGTPESILSFGRACRDSKNWRAGITLLIADAHVRASQAMQKTEKDRYLAHICPEIDKVYDEYFSHKPGDKAERCRYATFLYYCQRNDKAAEQFALAGDPPIAFSGVPDQEIRRIRDEVVAATKK